MKFGLSLALLLIVCASSHAQTAFSYDMTISGSAGSEVDAAEDAASQRSVLEQMAAAYCSIDPDLGQPVLMHVVSWEYIDHSYTIVYRYSVAWEGAGQMPFSAPPVPGFDESGL